MGFLAFSGSPSWLLAAPCISRDQLRLLPRWLGSKSSQGEGNAQLTMFFQVCLCYGCCPMSKSEVHSQDPSQRGRGAHRSVGAVWGVQRQGPGSTGSRRCHCLPTRRKSIRSGVERPNLSEMHTMRVRVLMSLGEGGKTRESSC